MLQNLEADERGAVYTAIANMGTEAKDHEVYDEALNRGHSHEQARRILDGYKELTKKLTTWLHSELNLD